MLRGMYYNFAINFMLINTTEEPSEIIKFQLATTLAECDLINQENSVLFNNIKQFNIQDKTIFTERYNSVEERNKEQNKLDTMKLKAESEYNELVDERRSIKAKLDEVNAKLEKKKECIKNIITGIVKIIQAIISKTAKAKQYKVIGKSLDIALDKGNDDDDGKDEEIEETQKKLELIQEENVKLSNQVMDSIQKMDIEVEQSIDNITKTEETNAEDSVENNLEVTKDECLRILNTQQDVLNDITSNLERMKEMSTRFVTILNNDELKVKVESLFNKLTDHINTLKSDINVTEDDIEIVEEQIKTFTNAINAESEARTFGVLQRNRNISSIIEHVLLYIVKNSFLGLSIQKHIFTEGINEVKRKTKEKKDEHTKLCTEQNDKVEKLQNTIDSFNNTILENSPRLSSVSNFDKVCNDVAIYQRNYNNIKTLNTRIDDLRSQLLKLGVSPNAFDLPVANQIQTVFSY